jgi:hypothetical protein
MKHINDGFILPEYAFRGRLGEASVLSVASGKRQSKKTGFICLAGRKIKKLKLYSSRDSCHIQLLLHIDNVQLLRK